MTVPVSPVAMDIGTEDEPYIIEPVTDPVPHEAPVEVPEYEPVPA